MSTAVIASTPRPSIGDAMAATLRRTAIVVAACGIAGALVGGIGSRLAMRLAALTAPEARGVLTENGNVVGEITLAGTVGLALVAGVGSAIFGAGAYTLVRPWLPRRVVARGIVFGGILLALMGSSIVDPANADFVLLGDRLMNVTVFSGLFLAFGLVASAAIASLEARVPPAHALSPRMWGLTAMLAIPVLPGLAGVAFGFGPELGIALAGAWAAMLLSPRLDHRNRRGVAQLVRAAATTALLVVVVLAGSEYVDGVLTIL